MAGILLKNCIKKFVNGELALEDSVVNVLSDELIAYVEIRTHCLEKQLSSILALLALRRWPKKWPSLVPNLLQQLSNVQEAGQFTWQTLHVMSRLHELLGQLSTKMQCAHFSTVYSELCWTLFPCVMKVWVPVMRDVHSGLSRYVVSGGCEVNEARFERDTELETKMYLATSTSKTLSLIVQAALPLIAARNACFRNFWKTYVSVIAPLSDRVRRSRSLYYSLFLYPNSIPQSTTAANLHSLSASNEGLQNWMFYQEEDANQSLDWVEEVRSEFLDPSFAYSGFYAQCHLLQALTKALTCTPVMAQRRFPQQMQPLAEPLLGFYTHHLSADFPLNRPDLRNLAQTSLPLRRLAFASLTLVGSVIQQILRENSSDSQNGIGQNDGRSDSDFATDNSACDAPQMSQSTTIQTSSGCGRMQQLQNHCDSHNVEYNNGSSCNSSSRCAGDNMRQFFTANRVTQLLEILCLGILCWTPSELQQWSSEDDAETFFFHTQLQRDGDDTVSSLRVAGERLCHALAQLCPDVVAQWLTTKLRDTESQSRLCRNTSWSNDGSGACEEASEDCLLYWDGVYYCAMLCVSELATHAVDFSLSDWCRSVLGPMLACLNSEANGNGVDVGVLRGGQSVLRVRLLQLLGKWAQSRLLQPQLLPDILAFLSSCLLSGESCSCNPRSRNCSKQNGCCCNVTVRKGDLVQRLYTAWALECVLQSEEVSLPLLLAPQMLEELCLGVLQVCREVQNEVEVRRWLLSNVLQVLLDLAQCGLQYHNNSSNGANHDEMMCRCGVDLLEIAQSAVTLLSPFSVSQMQGVSQLLCRDEGFEVKTFVNAGGGSGCNIFAPILCEVLQQILQSLSVQPPGCSLHAASAVASCIIGFVGVKEVSEESIMLLQKLLRSPVLDPLSYYNRNDNGEANFCDLLLACVRLAHNWLCILNAELSEGDLGAKASSGCEVSRSQLVYCVELIQLRLQQMQLQSYQSNTEIHNSQTNFSTHCGSDVVQREWWALLHDSRCRLTDWLCLDFGTPCKCAKATPIEQQKARYRDASETRRIALRLLTGLIETSTTYRWESNASQRLGACVAQLIVRLLRSASCPNLAAVCRSMVLSRYGDADSWSEEEVWYAMDVVAALITSSYNAFQTSSNVSNNNSYLGQFAVTVLQEALSVACRDIVAFCTCDGNTSCRNGNSNCILKPQVVLGQFLLLCEGQIEKLVRCGPGALLLRHLRWVQAMSGLCHGPFLSYVLHDAYDSAQFSREEQQWQNIALQVTQYFLQSTLPLLRSVSVTERATFLSQLMSEEICGPAQLATPTTLAYSTSHRNCYGLTDISGGVEEWDVLWSEAVQLEGVCRTRAIFKLHSLKSGVQDEIDVEVQLAEDAVSLSHRLLRLKSLQSSGLAQFHH
jgi:hypothetical protein